jgi:hypothetical protein
MVNGWFILYLLLLTMLALVLVVWGDKIDVIRGKKPMDVQIDDLAYNYTYKECVDFLDWMLMLGMINNLEYNEKLKHCSMFCVPYSRKRRSK